MKIKENIGVGDIVKLKKPIYNIDEKAGNKTFYEYGIVMELISGENDVVSVAPFNMRGNIELRKCGEYFLPDRHDVSIANVLLFLKGNEPDGSLKKI